MPSPTSTPLGFATKDASDTTITLQSRRPTVVTTINYGPEFFMHEFPLTQLRGATYYYKNIYNCLLDQEMTNFMEHNSYASAYAVL